MYKLLELDLRYFGSVLSIASWEVQKFQKRTPNAKDMAVYTRWLIHYGKEGRHELLWTLQATCKLLELDLRYFRFVFSIASWEVQECHKQTPTAKDMAVYTRWLMHYGKEGRHDLVRTLYATRRLLELYLRFFPFVLSIASWEVQECHKQTPNAKVMAVFIRWLIQQGKEGRHDFL